MYFFLSIKNNNNKNVQDGGRALTASLPTVCWTSLGKVVREENTGCRIRSETDYERAAAAVDYLSTWYICVYSMLKLLKKLQLL